MLESEFIILLNVTKGNGLPLDVLNGHKKPGNREPHIQVVLCDVLKVVVEEDLDHCSILN